MAIWNKNYYPMDKIEKWFSQGKSQSWVARKLEVDVRLIHKLKNKLGLVCVLEKNPSGDKHPRWTGGKMVDKDGYVLLYYPGHPNARKYLPNHILEHRLVMEKHLGRFLHPREVVHHINGDKKDNRIENLELYENNGKHLAYDLKGRCPNWSKEGKARLRKLARLRAGIPFGSKLNVT